ncbi:hypothetical protein EMIT0196MI5_260016 [Pseudomonas sp. IT-196MI5]
MFFFETRDVEQLSENFMSIQLLSTQFRISTQQIRKTLKRLKTPQLEFEDRTLRRHLIKNPN